jgi:uncharacterized protein (DUF697 family)
MRHLLNAGYDPALAGKTFGFLQSLQQPPTGGSVTAGNLDTMRKYLGRVAQETQPAQGGMVKATTDAAAASTVLDKFKSFTTDLPKGAVVAGDADAYTAAVQRANANYAASQRVGNLDARISRAENAADRQVAGSIANQIRSKVGGMLDNPKALRGLTDAEIAKLELINRGGALGTVLRQAGRGGAPHVIPVMGQLAAASASGGASLPLWAAMVGARLGDNALTQARAQALVDMLAKRSPLYQNRVNALPIVSTLPNQAQLLRSVLLGLQP